MKIVNATGKRKKSVARAVLKPGSGLVRVNRTPLELVQPEMARLKLKEPLILASDVAEGVDIDVDVMGGGYNSQAEAGRLAIAKALVGYAKSDKLKEKFLSYDRTLLVADVRQRETRKPNTHGKARSKRQTSYR